MIYDFKDDPFLQVSSQEPLCPPSPKRRPAATPCQILIKLSGYLPKSAIGKFMYFQGTSLSIGFNAILAGMWFQSAMDKFMYFQLASSSIGFSTFFGRHVASINNG